MTTLLIGCLACASLYLGHRWLGLRSENSQLRIHIAALKRQLAKRER